MANKYSKANLRPEEKAKQQPQERRRGFSPAARIMAIIMIVIMVVFAVVTAGVFLID